MKNIETTFEDFLTTQSVQIPLIDFSMNLIVTGLLAWFLSIIYVKYGRSISNRRLFARNIILLAVTTMVIITIVKSSLALSLGLVGALSIVRFRTAIKEPEELAFLFMSITIGLGMGADQAATIITAFAIIITFVVLRRSKEVKNNQNKSLFLTITTSENNKELDVSKLSEILSKYCSGIKLKRYDFSPNTLEVVFQVSISNIREIVKIQKSLSLLDGGATCSIIDEEGIVV
jgi:uncharacterized membrane protein YhiD involved in acid resistance